MKTTLFILIIVLADTAGDILLTKGMKEIGEISTLSPKALLKIFKKAVFNKNVLNGIFFMAVYFFSFLAVLSWADLSLVFPATTLVYVASTLGAKFILRETVGFHRWAGILFVSLGVALVSMS